MEDLIFGPLVVLLAATAHASVRRSVAFWEQRILDISFVAHISSAVVLVLLYTFYYTEGGDVTSYHHYGVPVAEALKNDFETIFPETVNVFLHRPHALPLELMGEGSTGTMQMVASYLAVFLGNSIYASGLAIAAASYFSKVLIYRSLKPEFEPRYHRALNVGCLLVPSAIFWTSATLKEPVVMVCLGPLFVAIRWAMNGRRIGMATALVIVFGGGVALIKPYILAVLIAAVGIWVIWSRILERRSALAFKPVYFAVGIALATAAGTILDRFMPMTQERGIAASLTYQRRAAAGDLGGSNFSIETDQVGATDTQGTSYGAQLALAPLALATAFFRPMIIEARSPVQLANAIEATWLLLIFLQLLRKMSPRQLLSDLVATPALMACFAFSIMLAAGVGLSTSNMGTLSRYRAPMMPFFAVVLLVLTEKCRERQMMVREVSVEPQPLPGS